MYNLFFKLYQLFHLVEEPGINAGQVMDCINIHAVLHTMFRAVPHTMFRVMPHAMFRAMLHTMLHGIFYIENSLGVGGGKLVSQFSPGERSRCRIFSISAKPEPADLKGSNTLLKSLFKGSADGHGLSH